MKKIIVAITGASGSIYSRQLLGELAGSKRCGTIAVIFTGNGREVSRFEGVGFDDLLSDPVFTVYDNADLFAPPASGSAGYDAMVIVPCSMGTAARIANGISADLVTRSADVILKERKKLIIVPRETPYSTIHLSNLLTLSRSGAVILPASPSFYSRPADMDQLCMTVTERILDHLGITDGHYRWDGK